MAEPERRRRRPAVSCTLCRKRKIRCDRESPCSNCVKSRKETLCVYNKNPPLRPRQPAGAPSSVQDALAPPGSICTDRASSTSATSTIHSQASPSLLAGSTTISTPVTHQGPDVECLKARIKQLEEQLSSGGPSSATSPPSPTRLAVQTTKSVIAGEFYLQNQSRRTETGHSQTMTRIVMHKTRLFGQSSWVTAVIAIRDIFELLEPYTQNGAKSIIGMLRCKQLARVIKAQRAPPWPPVPGSELPPKEVTDKLIDCYVRSTESLYRILHLPTFKRDYEALWHSQPSPDQGLLVQVKLVLAIGAATYDDHFSLRASAVRWVYEAQARLSEPEFKSRLSIQGLQTQILLIFARQVAGIGGALVWISVGSLLRSAVYMGLHRDPTRLPKPPAFFMAEMRRRLWSTILELALETSIDSGGPPFISLTDFDTDPPGNFDDDQLAMGEQPPLQSKEAFTETTVLILLGRTFSHRLAIAKFLNDFGSQGAYDEALRLDKEFRIAYKCLSRDLQVYNTSSTRQAPTHFQIGAVDLVMRNYLLCLHAPFFNPSVAETAFAFSRTVVIETALRVWQTAYSPGSSLEASGEGKSPNLELERIAAYTHTFLRRLGMQTSLLITMGLKGQLEEEDGLGPITLRPDMVCVVEEAKAWCLRSILAGETNARGYMLANMISTYIDGLSRRLGREELATSVIRAAKEAEDNCLPIFERMAMQGQGDGAPVGLDQMSLNTPADG